MARTILVPNGPKLNLPGKRREELRHFSHTSCVAAGVICGFGTHGYPLARQHLSKRFEVKTS
jgi:3-dehydroquinate dehydratase